MIRAMYNLDRISRSDDAWSDHAEVRARATDRSKCPRPALLPDPASEGRTRDARAGHLKDYLTSHPPALPWQGCIDLESDRCEVFAEEAVGQLTPETALPLIEILPLERVHGLLIAAVMLSIADEIPHEPAAEAGGSRPGGTHLYRPSSGLLADARPPGLLVRVGFGTPQVDGVQPCHRARLRN